MRKPRVDVELVKQSQPETGIEAWQRAVVERLYTEFKIDHGSLLGISNDEGLRMEFAAREVTIVDDNGLPVQHPPILVEHGVIYVTLIGFVTREQAARILAPVEVPADE